MCVLYLSPFFVYTPLTSYLNHISYVLNMFGFFFFFYIFLFFVHVYHQKDSISPSWARAGCKKSLSLINYPCEIKFIRSFIHSLSLSEYVWIALLPVYFCSVCMYIISRIVLVPHGRGLDVRRP